MLQGLVGERHSQERRQGHAGAAREGADPSALRLEARLSLYGNDIDETTNPIEAGLGWVVKLGKRDFVGKSALERIKADGPARKLVGFEVTGRGIARHGYPLLDKTGAKVGVCTSGGPGPTVGKNIGLGYLPSAMTNGTVASEITLLMTVGLPNKPLIAGSGGLARTWPRRPSRLSSSEVSSPQT